MTTESDEIKLEAQQKLDELFDDGLIPLRLTARVVESIGMDEYIVRFNESWLRSVDISWEPGEPFSAVFQTAVLDRVSRVTSTSRAARTDYRSGFKPRWASTAP